MKRQQQTETDKLRSPHPGLQSVLPRLKSLNSERAESRPIFDNKAKAKLFIDIQEREQDNELMLTPVWRIDHTDLGSSEVKGWTVTKYPC
jgi:hypothetical protein